MNGTGRAARWRAVAALSLLLSPPLAAQAPRAWGRRMADTLLAEHPELWRMRKSDGDYRWSYTPALVGLGLLRLHDRAPDPRYPAYVQAYVDHYVDADGAISTFAPQEFNIDSLLSGRLLFPLLEATGDARYRTAIEQLRRQLRWQPRTRDGLFWHKLKYPWQVWLDGLYMGAPFHAEATARFGPPADFDDVARQFRESRARLVDWNEATGRATLRNVCKSAGLGGEPYRDGSYAYYVSTEVVANDAHGVGAFLLASAEIE